VALIDLGKAGGDVAIEIIWKEMENINLIIIEATIGLYENNTTKIKKR
jgi:hypothetical protein